MTRLYRLRIGNIQNSCAGRNFGQGTGQIALHQLRSPSGIEKDRIGPHTAELFIGHHSPGLFIVGEMVGNHQAFFKNRIQIALLHTQPVCFLLRKKGIEYQNMIFIIFQMGNDQLSYRPHSDNSNLSPIVSGHLPHVLPGCRITLCPIQSLRQVKPLPCKQNLCSDILRHRNRIGGKCAENMHSTGQIRLCKALNGACCIKNGLQSGKTVAYLILLQRKHSPCRKDIIHFP